MTSPCKQYLAALCSISVSHYFHLCMKRFKLPEIKIWSLPKGNLALVDGFFAKVLIQVICYFGLDFITDYITYRIYKKSYDRVPGLILLLWLNFNCHQYHFILYALHALVFNLYESEPWSIYNPNFAVLPFQIKHYRHFLIYLPQPKEKSQNIPGIELSALPWAITIAIMTIIFISEKTIRKLKFMYCQAIDIFIKSTLGYSK